MERILMILEVSRKQDYIFGSKKLKSNVERSRIIDYVTGNSFFEEYGSGCYDKKSNMIYSGGGHTVLQFEGGSINDAKEKADKFAKIITRAAMITFDGLELFVKQIPFDPNKSAAENLRALSAQLEQKKSLRKSLFRQVDFGIEKLDSEEYKPLHVRKEENVLNIRIKPWERAPEGWDYPSEFEKLAGDDNFISIVHIDGNSMGTRVNDIYDSESSDWNACCQKLRRFSEGIQSDFEAVFAELVDTILDIIESSDDYEIYRQKRILPIRPVILAGDDVCFVTTGDLGIECARIFLRTLSGYTNQEDKKEYAGCAGVAIVHKKFPFHQAYDLSEQLCSNAKKFGVNIKEDGSVSAMDWHIEFGQMRSGLSETRQDYITEDGNRLELRPVAVVLPEGCECDQVRTYDFFKAMSMAIQKENSEKAVARSKIKQFREALKHGEVESNFYLEDKGIKDLLYLVFTSETSNKEEQIRKYIEMLRNKEGFNIEAFFKCKIDERTKPENNKTKERESYDKEKTDNKMSFKRCLFFDAIEMMDHCRFIGEV